MKIRLLSAIVLGLALSAACAQDASQAQPGGQGSGMGAGGWQGQGQNQGQNQSQNQGQRGGRSGWGGGGMMGAGRGVMGTVTEVAAEHYTIKTDAGEIYTVHYSANTRIMKQMAPRRGPGEGREGGTPPQPLKPADIKVGDVITALGELDTAAKSIGAMLVLQVDPERAKEMREMQASYGKTWLMGKVTAVDGVKVTLMGSVDNTAHSFVADENTTFRMRRDPITLADIQVGDTVRVTGAVKDGSFVAASVMAMRMQPGGEPMVPRGDQPR
jgi:hypothetical protein